MAFFRNMGPLEIFLILIAILIIFGIGKLPSAGRGMGQAIREFRTSVKDDVPGPEEAIVKVKTD